MDNYKLPSMVKYCRACPCHGLNSPYSRKIYGLISPYRYRTIFIRAEIHKECNRCAKSFSYDNIFQKALCETPVGLYHRTPVYNMIDKCCTFQAADEIEF